MTDNNANSVEELQNNQGLAYSAKKVRNIRIILSIISVIVIGALVTVAVILLININDDNEEDKIGKTEKLNLNDLLMGKYSARRQNTTWLGCDNVSYREQSTYVELNLSTNEKRILLDSFKYGEPLTKSPDEKYLLLVEESFTLFRHSFTAKYYVLDLESKIIAPITINGIQQRLVLVKWGPVGSSLIINLHGNLYYKNTPLEKEVQLTFDVDPRILNGIPDWVYEEEVLSGNEAVWFSPDGNKIAYIQFNDIETQFMTLQYYGEPSDPRFQYPSNKPVAYPKVGSPNPIVKLFIIDIEEIIQKGNFTQLAVTNVPVPKLLSNREHIITIVTWLSNEVLYSVWMNRIQNEAHMQTFTKKESNDIYFIKSLTGWVDLFSPPLINGNGTQVALILPHNQGKDGPYKHLSILNTNENSPTPNPLTNGKYVVDSLLKWDPETNVIFYMANSPEKTESLHLYAIQASTDSGMRKAQCLTCNLIEFEGIQQTYFSADFSPCGNNVIITSLGPNPPSVHIFRWSFLKGNINLEKLFDWQLNSELRKTLKTLAVPKKEILTIDIEDDMTAKVLLSLPPDMDKSKKYPMLVEVYGGPGSFAVTDKWNLDWGSYLTSARSIIHARIDGRGSGLRGDKLLHSVYKRLGTVEVYDQINVTRKLQHSLSYIDPEKTGIWGWSYGGYASGRALALDNRNVFACAVSVAPVTDWIYYDSIYTERYLQLPSSNPEGYDNSRLTALAKQFDGKKYLIVHGTFDDNVHYQQSLILIRALELENILFRQISYPDENHSLASMRQHLYNSLNTFFGTCFGLEENKFFK